MTIYECKELVYTKLVQLGVIDPMAYPTPRCIRLRDFSSYNYDVGKIWKDEGKTLKDAYVSLYDHYPIVAQVIEPPYVSSREELWGSGSHSLDSAVCIVQKFDRATRTMGHMFEICIPLSATVAQFGTLLSEVTNTPINYLEVLVLQTNVELKLFNMSKRNPLNGTDDVSCESWFSFEATDITSISNMYGDYFNSNNNDYMCNTVSNQWRQFRDGIMILYQNTCELLREYSAEEQLCIREEHESKEWLYNVMNDHTVTKSRSNIWNTEYMITEWNENKCTSVTTNAIETIGNDYKSKTLINNSRKVNNNGIKIKSKSDWEIYNKSNIASEDNSKNNIALDNNFIYNIINITTTSTVTSNSNSLALFSEID